MKKLLLSLGALSAVVAPVAAVVACGSTDSNTNKALQQAKDGYITKINASSASDADKTAQIAKVNAIKDLSGFNQAFSDGVNTFIAANVHSEGTATQTTSEKLKAIYSSFYNQEANGNFNHLTFNLVPDPAKAGQFKDAGAAGSSDEVKARWAAIDNSLDENFEAIRDFDVTTIKTKGETIDLQVLKNFEDNPTAKDVLKDWSVANKTGDENVENSVLNPGLWKDIVTTFHNVLVVDDEDDITSLPHAKNADRSKILWGYRIITRVLSFI